MEQHKISFWTAVLMNINVMVGVGIFAFPSLMAAQAGYASFIGWPIIALIFLPIVLCIATMARIFPGAGSFYSYSKDAINQTSGFISGWSFYLAYTGVASLMAIILRDTVVLPIYPMNPYLFNLLFVGLITAISLSSMNIIAKIQNTGTIFKLLPLIIVIAISAFYWNPSFNITMAGIKKLPSIVPLAVFGFWGFEGCCSISHLIKGKKENASHAILLAFLLTAAVYTLFHAGLLHIMGGNLATENVKDFVNFLGFTSPFIVAPIKFTISLAFILAFANAILSIFTMTSTTLHSFANENLLPGSHHLAKLNANHRPSTAILLQGLVIFGVTCTTSNKYMLTSLINFGVLISFIFTLVALYLIQKRTGMKKQMPITIAAFCSWAIFTYFSLDGMGDTFILRAMGTLTVIGAIGIGYVLYRYQKRSQHLEV